MRPSLRRSSISSVVMRKPLTTKKRSTPATSEPNTSYWAWARMTPATAMARRPSSGGQKPSFGAFDTKTGEVVDPG